MIKNKIELIVNKFIKKKINLLIKINFQNSILLY